MDRASALIFPGSKTLAGWWRQLHAYQPQAFWVGYSFLHRIEAPVTAVRRQSVEPFPHLVLQALALEKTDRVSLPELCSRLGLPALVVQRVLADMERDGFLARTGPDRWQATERGTHALQWRHYPQSVQERRVFAFLDRLDTSGQRANAPQFVNVVECAGTPWPVDDEHRFDIATLQACIEQTVEWKQARAFPAEVQMLTNTAPAVSWEHVIVDRPERVLLVLIVGQSGGAAVLLGFAVKVDNWTLYDQTPVLRLPASESAIWPDLAKAPAAEVWHEAWRSWCRQRQLPTNEVELCALTHREPRLEVQPPPRLLQRLQAAKSDLFRGEAWLLVGDGYVRWATQLTVRA